MKRILSALFIGIALATGLLAQVVIPAGTSLNITGDASTPSGGTPAFGPGSSTDYALAAWNGTGGNLLRNTLVLTDANGDLIMPSTATNGLQLYNTADQTTNYERLETKWGANEALIQMVNGGSGALRLLRIRSGGGAQFAISPNGTPVFSYIGQILGTVSQTFMQVGQSYSNTATSGTNIGFSVIPTYNQASGTAANTDILGNRTQTLVGTGTQKGLDLQVGSTSWYSFNYGNTATTGGFNSSSTVEPAVTFAPIINQSGTAGYTALKVNVTQTTTGSGAKLLMDFQADGATKFNVDNAGLATLTALSATPRLTLTRTTTNAGSAWIEGGNGGIMNLATASTVAVAIDASQNATFSAKVVSTSATAGIGYATGAGGAVTQATDKTTAVTLNTVTGAVTMAGTALAAGTSVGFTVNDSAVATLDYVGCSIDSAATLNSYTVTVDSIGAGTFHIHLRNESAGSLSEAIVLRFVVIKAVSS